MIGFNGGLIGAARETSAIPSVPGVWTPREQLKAKRVNLWPSDPYFPNVSLLLRGNGTNGSTIIVDESSSPKTVTAVGNAQISTAQSKYGGASLYFDGAVSTRLICSSSSDFAFGTSAYTVEAWIRATNYASGQGSIFDSGNASGAFDFFLTNSGSLGIGIYGVGNLFTTSASAVALNQWTHAAVARSSTSASDTRIYVDGILAATGTDSTNWTTATTPSVGGINILQYSYIGYIDDLRITKGVARYTSNFTPPGAL
jgi:hypothetical protein